MFDKRSRYQKVDTVTVLRADGERMQAVKLRRLPKVSGGPHVVRTADQLDVLAGARYDDGAGFWRIADANTELEANELVATDGRTIQVPRG